MCVEKYKNKNSEYVGLSSAEIKEVTDYHNEIRAACGSQDMMKMVNIIIRIYRLPRAALQKE